MLHPRPARMGSEPTPQPVRSRALGRQLLMDSHQIPPLHLLPCPVIAAAGSAACPLTAIGVRYGAAVPGAGKVRRRSRASITLWSK